MARRRPPRTPIRRRAAAMAVALVAAAGIVAGPVAPRGTEAAPEQAGGRTWAASAAADVVASSRSARAAAPAAAGAGTALTGTPGTSTFLAVDPVRLLHRAHVGADVPVVVRVPGVPVGATAVALTVTVTAAAVDTVLDACRDVDCGPTVALNVPAGKVRSAPLVAPLGGADGDLVTLSSPDGGLEVSLDLGGFHLDPTATAAGSWIRPVSPLAVLDEEQVGDGEARLLDLPDVPAEASAVVLGLRSSAGTAGPVSVCAADVPVPDCSRSEALWTSAAEQRSTTVVVRLGGASDHQVRLVRGGGDAQLGLDVHGYLVPALSPSAGAVRGVVPRPVHVGALSPDAIVHLDLPDVPADARGVVLQVVVSGREAGGEIGVCPVPKVSVRCVPASATPPQQDAPSTHTVVLPLGDGVEGVSLRNGEVLVDAEVRLAGLVVPLARTDPDADVERPAADSDLPADPASPGAPGGAGRQGPYRPAPTEPAPAPDPVARPTAGTTGVPAGTVLTPHQGDITVVEPGTVLDGLDVHGRIDIRAENVTIRNTRVRGSGNATFTTGLITCYHARCVNALVEDTTLIPDSPSYWFNGIHGHDYTARRVRVAHVVDGFQVHNVHNGGGPVNVVIEASHCSDLAYFAADPNQGGGPSHNDCIQIQGGSNITIRGNTLVSRMATTVADQSYDDVNRGSGVMVTPNVAPVTGAVIEKNWIDGGEASVALSRGRYPSMHLGTVAENRFGRNQVDFGRGSRYVIRVQEDITFDAPLTSNMWADGTGRLSVGRDTGIRYDP